MTYQEQIKAIEDYMDASLGVNGEITRKAEEAVREMKAAAENKSIIPDDVNFWCERAKYYEGVCGQLMADIAKGVTLDSMSINENGITFTKSKEPVKEMKAEDVPEINVGKMKTFTVFDTKTGREADPYEIALHENWAKLVYCDMEGFAILENGSLILADECGKFEYCPEGRFEVRWDV